MDTSAGWMHMFLHTCSDNHIFIKNFEQNFFLEYNRIFFEQNIFKKN
jgi:hypothetical protein